MAKLRLVLQLLTMSRCLHGRSSARGAEVHRDLHYRRMAD